MRSDNAPKFAPIRQRPVVGLALLDVSLAVRGSSCAEQYKLFLGQDLDSRLMVLNQLYFVERALPHAKSSPSTINVADLCRRSFDLSGNCTDPDRLGRVASF